MLDVPRFKHHDSRPYTFSRIPTTRTVACETCAGEACETCGGKGKIVQPAPMVFHTRHLGDTNAAYVDSWFKREKPGVEVGDYASLNASRDESLQDLAKYCITGWENVTSKGAPIECTPENALKALRDLIEAGWEREVEAYVRWARFLTNFREPIADPDELGNG